MMTSSNGNIFRTTGPLCGEFAGHRWIPYTKASDAEFWCFLWSAPWINCWVNNRKADNLRRQYAHYDITVMRDTRYRKAVARSKVDVYPLSGIPMAYALPRYIRSCYSWTRWLCIELLISPNCFFHQNKRNRHGQKIGCILWPRSLWWHHAMQTLAVLLAIHYSNVTMFTMASQITDTRRRSKKTSKFHITGLCEGNAPVTSGFPSQRVCNAENVSIWWRSRVDYTVSSCC